MPKYGRLGSNSEFSSVYKNAKKWHCDAASIHFLAFDEKARIPECQNIKFAVVASKKIGNAVVRNRAKRRLRAMFCELFSQIKNGSYIFVAKESFINLEHTKALKSLRWALDKVGAFK